MPRSAYHPPVPAHLESYLRDSEGQWTLFDGRYLTRPHEMPVDYLAETSVIERYAIGRLSAANVRAAIFSFSPHDKLTDRDCQKWAQRLVQSLNEKMKHQRYQQHSAAVIHGQVPA